jgi:hypothetical protein
MDNYDINISNYNGTLVDLAHQLSNLRYEALVEFLESLSIKLDKDAENDYNAGRVYLGSELSTASIKIQEAATSIEKAWKISKPYVE